MDFDIIKTVIQWTGLLFQATVVFVLLWVALFSGKISVRLNNPLETLKKTDQNN